MTEDEILALPYRPCVGVVVQNADGLVWAGRRIDNPSKDGKTAWQMPQGGVDEGEAPRAAAFRELTEETSIPANAVTLIGEMDEWIPYDLPHDLVPKLWKGRFRGQTQKWFLLRFTGDDSDIDIATEHQEFGEWRWAALSELVEMAIDFKRDTYRQVVAAFIDHFPEEAR